MGMFANLPDAPEEPKPSGYRGMFADLPDAPATKEKPSKAGFFETSIRDPLEKIPFSPYGMVKTAGLVQAAQRLGSGKDYAEFIPGELKSEQLGGMFGGYRRLHAPTAKSLKAEDTELLTKHFEEIAKREKQGYTLMGHVGSITSRIPAYAIEFLATGGLKQLGSKAAQEIGEKILKESAKKGLGKAAVGLSKFAAGAGTRAFVGMPHRAAETILQRRLPKDVTIDDLGNIHIIKPDEKIWTSIWKGALDHYIEIASEQAGEFMGPAVNKVVGKLPFMGKAVGAMQRAWLNKFPTKKATDFTKKLLARGGFHGVLGEIGEEDLGWIARAIFDVEDYGAGPNASIGERLKAGLAQDIENLPAELIAFSIPSLVGKGVTQLFPRETVSTEPTPAETKMVAKPKVYEVIEYDTQGKEKGPVEETFTTKEEAQAYAETMTESPYTPGTFEVRAAAKPVEETLTKRVKDLEKLAREKGLEPEIPPGERKFKEPTITHLLTPQLYEAEKLGVKFMTKPAEIGKQALDIEFNRHVRDLDKVARIINKLGGETVKSKTAAKLKNKPTKSIERFTELLNTHEEAPAELSDKETVAFNYFRNLSRSLIARENKVRTRLGMDLIPYKPGYVRHIVDIMAQEMIDGRYPIPEDLKFWAEEKVKAKIHNPMEFQRQLGDELEGIFSKDLIKLSKAMMWTGLKEIHLDEPLKFFEYQLSLHSEVIPSATRRWTEKFINHMIKGQPTDLDKGLDALVTKSGLNGLFNKILAPFGRVVSNKPLTNLMQKAGRLQIYGVMGWRPKQLIRNKFQLVQNLALYSIKANLKSFLPASKQLKALLSESLFLEGYKGFEDLTAIDKKILGRGWLAPFQWTAVSNARQAMKCAYWDTLDLIENSRYKKFEWADSKRTYKEKSESLYESEKEKILSEMEFGAGVTQYHYIPMAMPEVFRHKALTPFTRLQSWWMNHFFKFHTEAATRLLKGETGYGQKLPWSRRIGWGRYMVIGGVILNTLGYTRSYLLGAAPDSFPPIGKLLANMFIWLKAIWLGNTKTRQSAERKMLASIKTFIPGYLAIKDIKAVMSGKKSPIYLFFYGKEKKSKYERRRKARHRKPRRHSR